MPGSPIIPHVLSPETAPLWHPLDDFYARQNMAFPEVISIPGEEVPQPYQRLLVHTQDMTPTLEKYHEAKIHLRVLRRQQMGDYYFREVVLLLDGSETLVEFGAIKINLALFPPSARRDILQERLPLGHIL